MDTHNSCCELWGPLSPKHYRTGFVPPRAEDLASEPGPNHWCSPHAVDVVPAARGHHKAHQRTKGDADRYPDNRLDRTLALGGLAYSGNRVLIYGYCRGVASSRRIERATYEDVAFRYLAADQHPDHDTIATFRQEHLAPLAQLFVQVLQLCQGAGLVKLGHGALDGTKIQANASKHKAMSYERMEKAEKE
jgi:transposase